MIQACVYGFAIGILRGAPWGLALGVGLVLVSCWGGCR